MKNKPKVSIIIPVYKVEPYIEQCITSVLAQTYRQLEVILVDDCTPDHSMEIALKCIHIANCKDLEYKYLRHNQNLGISVARNSGIKAATGEFLYFIDSDDWILPECIELLVECVEKYPDAEIVYGGIKISGDSPWNLGIENKDLPCYSGDRDWINKALLQGDVFHVMVGNKLERRTFVMKHKLLFEEGINHEDDIRNFEMAKYVSKIAVCKHDTYIYVIHENSFMTNLKDDLFKIRTYRMAVIKYFVNHITDQYRKRQISYVRDYIRIFFPLDSVSDEFKDDIRYVYNRLIEESKGRQKVCLWLYYTMPRHFLYILNKSLAHFNIHY